MWQRLTPTRWPQVLGSRRSSSACPSLASLFCNLRIITPATLQCLRGVHEIISIKHLEQNQAHSRLQNPHYFHWGKKPEDRVWTERESSLLVSAHRLQHTQHWHFSHFNVCEEKGCSDQLSQVSFSSQPGTTQTPSKPSRYEPSSEQRCSSPTTQLIKPLKNQILASVLFWDHQFSLQPCSKLSTAFFPRDSQPWASSQFPSQSNILSFLRHPPACSGLHPRSRENLAPTALSPVHLAAKRGAQVPASVETRTGPLLMLMGCYWQSRQKGQDRYPGTIVRGDTELVPTDDPEEQMALLGDGRQRADIYEQNPREWVKNIAGLCK